MGQDVKLPPGHQIIPWDVELPPRRQNTPVYVSVYNLLINVVGFISDLSSCPAGCPRHRALYVFFMLGSLLSGEAPPKGRNTGRSAHNFRLLSFGVQASGWYSACRKAPPK